MTTDTRRVVDAYHRAWTTGAFDQAIALLSPHLETEVPINEYATTQAFGDALTNFGRRVRAVRVLSLLAHDDEAMILYDMHVDGLGPMRIVEHFTVADGQITKLRHIHDTVALRTAGSTNRADESYADVVHIGATPEQVFSALTTREGIADWWTAKVTGDGRDGGQLDLRFAGLAEHIIMTVDTAEPNAAVRWRCERHTGHPEWEGTTITFAITPTAGGTDLAIHHHGLLPELHCYEQCSAGWGHFARSIKAYAEHGEGMPFHRGAR